MKKSTDFYKYLLIGLALVLIILGVISSKKEVKEPSIPADVTVNENAEQADKSFEDVDAGEFFLQVGSPKDGITVSSPTITVSGKTKSNADVFINDLETKADDDGVFSADLSLEEGENIIIITAGDDEGNFDEKELTINYEVTE